MWPYIWPCIGNLGSNATIVSNGFSRRPMNFYLAKTYQRAPQKTLNNKVIGKVKVKFGQNCQIFMVPCGNIATIYANIATSKLPIMFLTLLNLSPT
jgi:hypothetical protein